MTRGYPNRPIKQSDAPDDETVARFRSLFQGLALKAFRKNQTASSLRQRLLTLSDEIARLVRNEARSRCVCRCKAITVLESWNLELAVAELNDQCSIHGPFRLGVIVAVTGYPSEADSRDRQLQDLLRAHDRRCVIFRNSEAKANERAKGSL